MHVAGREDVDEESNKGNEQRVDAAQAIHRQTKISTKAPDLNPDPEMIHDWLHRT